MNKALKTIAWICLILGLLGTLADAGMLAYGCRLAAERQTAFQAIPDTDQAGNNPDAKNTCIAEDANQDGKPDGDCLPMQAPGQVGQPGAGQPGFRGQLQKGGTRLGMPGGFAARHLAGRMLLPLFFLALGPILLVIGAVILLVNREPKETARKGDKKKEVKETKEPKKR